MRRIDSAERIQTMSDEELASKYHHAKTAAQRASHEGDCYYEAEVDACYFFRELEVREQRRVAHQNWLAARAKRVARRTS